MRVRLMTLMVPLLFACGTTEGTPLDSVELQAAVQPQDEGWRALTPEALSEAEGDTLWLRVAVPASTVSDPAVQVPALFADDAWACGRQFALAGRLPILPLPCTPTQVLLRANGNIRFGSTTFIMGSQQELWSSVLRRDLPAFVVGATMALVGLLFLAAGLRAGAERTYRGLGLFLASLGTLALLGTQLRFVLPWRGTTLFYAHEVATSLYPIGFADFLLGTFGDGPWRVLHRGLRLFVVYVVVAWALHVTGLLHINLGRVPTVLFIVVFLVQGLLLAARTRKSDASARVFLVGLGALLLLSAPDIIDGAGFELLGFQTVPYAVLTFGVAMVVLVERQHRRAREEALANASELAAKLAALEERNREINSLNHELRHQIAERSRAMAEALQGGTAEVRAARALQPGDVVEGRYRVTRALGRGAMGAVLAVERLTDDKVFALKMMTGEVDAQAAARFAREAEIAARVSDEHLVKVVDVGGSSSGQLYLVMEYVDGLPLEDHRARFGNVPWALGVLAQVAAGVRALHAAGVVHRDLKPGNVLITTAGDHELAKISDFGISRRGEAPGTETPTRPSPAPSPLVMQPGSPPLELASTLSAASPPQLDSTHLSKGSRQGAADLATKPTDALDALVAQPMGLHATQAPASSLAGSPADASSPALTLAGALLGTPAYMAPELANGAQEASPASDLFALGLIAYEVLTGQSAFEQPPVLTAFSHRPLPAVAPLPASVPPAVAALVLRSLAERPGTRPTAQEFVDAFSTR